MMKNKIGLPQWIIICYLLILLVLVKFTGISYIDVLNESLVKWVMNGVLVI